jgi:hypothetical protein
MQVHSFEIDEEQLKQLVMDKLAEKAIWSIDFDKRQAFEDKIKKQFDQIDTAEISKQATRFLIAKVMGEI